MQLLNIVKIGGNVLEEKGLLERFATDFTALEGQKILVHGGGKAATRLSQKLGLTPKMIEGRRITDADALEVVTMVYGGLANKNLVALLQAKGCNAIGLTGADANLIRAQKRQHPTIDYGYVGDVPDGGVDTHQIGTLMQGGLTPVFCALTHDGQGHLLNTNADTIAATLAKALAPLYKVCLTYCFEKPGVLQDANDDNTVISKIDTSLYQQLKDEKVIFEGMIPKLDNAFDALIKGVGVVKIKHAANLGNNIGTDLIN